MNASSERGDTLIEVIFATAVLALVIVIALAIMNSGTMQSQRAVEATFVRQGIDSQSELLRFARDSYVNNPDDPAAKTLWNGIKAKRVPATSTPAFTTLATSDCTPSSGNAFYLTDTGGSVGIQSTFGVPPAYALPGKGMWILATPNSPTATYVDFYIYACWNSAIGNGKATSGTIVRLYVPA